MVDVSIVHEKQLASKILVDISAHGFGHLAQTVPMIEALRSELPQVEFVIRTGVPPRVIEERLGHSICIVPSDFDFGLVMNSPFDVNRQASFARYAALHRDYEAVVQALASWIRQEGFAGVLSNISYPVIAGAHYAGVPVVAVSSLNWLEMFNHYCGSFEGGDEIAEQIRASYLKASVFCRLLPGTPMPDLRTTVITEPVVRVGTSQRETLLKRLGRNSETRIVVFAFGGMSGESGPPWSVATNKDCLLFGPESWARERPWTPIDAGGIPFIDLLASADAVITKPGYGIVSEVAALGVPTLLLTRGDWPEEPYLVDWLRDHGRCEYLDLTLDALDSTLAFECIDKLTRMRPKCAVRGGGERQVAAIMRQVLQS